MFSYPFSYGIDPSSIISSADPKCVDLFDTILAEAVQDAKDEKAAREAATKLNMGRIATYFGGGFFKPDN